MPSKDPVQGEGLPPALGSLGEDTHHGIHPLRVAGDPHEAGGHPQAEHHRGPDGFQVEADALNGAVAHNLLGHGHHGSLARRKAIDGLHRTEELGLGATG